MVNQPNCTDVYQINATGSQQRQIVYLNMSCVNTNYSEYSGLGQAKLSERKNL